MIFFANSWRLCALAVLLLSAGRFTGYPNGQNSPSSRVTVIRAGLLIDGTGSPPVSNVVVLIREQRIVEIGPSVKIPENAEVIDLSTRTVLPGFIDAHTHISSEGGGDRQLDPLASTGADYALVAAENARKMLHAGFTTIRDLGGRDYADLAVKRAIERGLVEGPRAFVATTSLSMTGGHADPTNGMSPFIQLQSPSGVVDGADAIRQKVRELIKYGADVIKFSATGGGLSKGDKPTAQHYSDEEMRALVDEAHRLGVKVAVHAHGTEGIKAAIRAGADSIEHGIYLDEEACRMMIERGTFFVPTLWIADEYFDRYQQWKIPPWAHTKISAFIPTALKSVEMAIRLGVKIALGTDAGVGEHELSAREFGAYVKHGMKPMDAIVAGTSNAARLIGHEQDFGTLEAGKLADIVAVDGNPLQNIQVLEDVKFVMKAGSVKVPPK